MQSDGVSVDIRYKVTGSFGRCPGDDTKHTDTHTHKKKKYLIFFFCYLVLLIIGMTLKTLLGWMSFFYPNSPIGNKQ